MGTLLGAGLRIREWRHDRRFERATAAPERAQAAALRTLLQRNAGTAFGREHGFAAIRTPAEYRRAVPLRDYEAFRPYVRRIVAGEPGVLTAEPVTAFATTSGTTGEAKLVPVTASWLSHMAGVVRLWMLRAQREHPALLDRAILTLVSPAVEGRTPLGVPVGALSGLLQRSLPSAVQRAQAVPYAAHLIADCEARAFVLLRLALARAVSVIGTPNPTTLLRLAEVARQHAEGLLRAIHDGTLGIPWPAIHEEPDWNARAVRRAVAARLAPDPRRARTLAAAVREAATLRLRDAWPELALIGCWLGGHAGHHARRLSEDYGDVPRRDLGLVASEGRVTLPLADGSAAGVLAIDAGFLEFIPEEALGRGRRPGPAGARARGRPPLRHRPLRSATVCTATTSTTSSRSPGTTAGRRSWPSSRKGRDMTSLTGEKLHLNHLRAAVHAAEGATGVEVWQFRLIPDVETCRYDLLVEPRGAGLDAPGAEAFARAIDEALGRANVEYAAKRRSRRLGPPRLCVMRAGWAERQCRAEFARGRREGQHKWPAIQPAWDRESRGEVVRVGGEGAA